MEPRLPQRPPGDLSLFSRIASGPKRPVPLPADSSPGVPVDGTVEAQSVDQAESAV